MGDSSDNVPGAPGIGPKTALKLLETYGSVEEVLAHAEEVKAKRPRESLLGNREEILLSRELVTIRTDVEVGMELEDLRVSEPDNERLRPLYVDLEFRTLLDRLDREAGEAGRERPPEAEYRLVTEPGDLAWIARACREAGRVGVAVLNATLQPVRGRVAGIAVAPEVGTAYYLPLGHGGEVALELGGGAPERANEPARTGQRRLRAHTRRPGRPRGHQGGPRPQALPHRVPPGRAGAGRTLPRRDGRLVRAGPGAPPPPGHGRARLRPPGPGT